MEQKYFNINKASWNAKTDIHYHSDFYNNEEFLKGKSSLKEIELNILPDLNGKDLLHLQCHFGQDSISLEKLGADVTAVDLSDQAIARANELNTLMNTNVKFVNCNVYDIHKHIEKRFDVIFTSYGTIGWLPDLDKWAQLISNHLKKGGLFIFAEFHPVVWMFDDLFKKVDYSYFNKGVILETLEGSYAEKQAQISQEYAMWNHSLSDVIQNLIKSGLKIDLFQEYDYSPYNCFKKTIEFEHGKYRIAGLEEKLPMVYSIVASKE